MCYGQNCGCEDRLGDCMFTGKKKPLGSACNPFDEPSPEELAEILNQPEFIEIKSDEPW